MTAPKPKIHIERMMYRTSIAVMGESAASYALIKLIPTGLGGSLGLNLALVLDVSGSMYEEDGTGISRLRRVQDAARSALNYLKPNDTLSIIAFAHNSSVLLPPTPISDRAKIEDVIEKVDMYDVDPGGTAMDQGIGLGMTEVEKLVGAGKLSQVVVLTDGETSGERDCRRLAQEAAKKKIRFTVIGVGTEWNSNLIKDLAKHAEGRWAYIDVNDAAAAEKVFVDEFKHLAATAFNNVEMHLRLKKDVKVKRVRMVTPELKDMVTTEPEERHLVSGLGTLEKDKTTRYILDMSLPKRPDGKFSIADIEITYDAGTGSTESTGPVALEIIYTSTGQGHVNAEVAKYIDDIQVGEMNQVLQDAIAKGDTEKAQQVAEKIEKKAEVMGKRGAKKTMLAKQVLDELNVTGKVSKKTQLATDDMMRMVEES